MMHFSEDQAIYLGVTDFVDDEKPLWVTLNDQTHRISHLGFQTGTHATAGFYQVPGFLFEKAPPVQFSSLRYYLKWLQEQGHMIYGVPLKDVIDIDSPKDIQVAESKLMEYL